MSERKSKVKGLCPSLTLKGDVEKRFNYIKEGLSYKDDASVLRYL